MVFLFSFKKYNGNIIEKELYKLSKVHVKDDFSMLYDRRMIKKTSLINCNVCELFLQVAFISSAQLLLQITVNMLSIPSPTCLKLPMDPVISTLLCPLYLGAMD